MAELSLLDAAQAEDIVTESLAEALQALLDQGFTLPFCVAAVGINGVAAMMTYDTAPNGLAPTFQLEPTGDMALPINMMFVDARGEAARLLIKPSGERRLTH